MFYRWSPLEREMLTESLPFRPASRHSAGDWREPPSPHHLEVITREVP